MSFIDKIFGTGGGSKAAGKANEAYEAQIQKAIAEYRSSEKQGRGDVEGYYQKGLDFEQPYLQAGQQGLQSYLGTLGLGDRQGAINRFQQSSGYKFALQQGEQATRRGEAARGLSGSGAEQRALTQFGQGTADQEYGKYQSQLAGVASMGAGMSQTAAGQAMGTGRYLASLGQGYAQDIGGAYGSLGAGKANSIMAGYGADASQRAALFNAYGKMVGGAMGAAGGRI